MKYQQSQLRPFPFPIRFSPVGENGGLHSREKSSTSSIFSRPSRAEPRTRAILAAGGVVWEGKYARVQTCTSIAREDSAASRMRRRTPAGFATCTRMTDSPRRPALSEVTEHKVMTVVGHARIPCMVPSRAYFRSQPTQSANFSYARSCPFLRSRAPSSSFPCSSSSTRLAYREIVLALRSCFPFSRVTNSVLFIARVQAAVLRMKS